MGRHQRWGDVAPPAPVSVFADQCPHRHLPLSAGTVVEGRLRSAYHGWEFDPARQASTVQP
ncbi:MAG: hypothetical protein DLM59_11895 [Pseudonocardiales bacterium]|nr:MAG: hypothetical protein DLM59_11895 [Pseudonocardiales bacterium]